jgi:hypothetical protein
LIPNWRDWVAVVFTVLVLGGAFAGAVALLVHGFRSSRPGVAEGALWFAAVFFALVGVGLFASGATEFPGDKDQEMPVIREWVDAAATLTWALSALLCMVALVVAGIAFVV